MKKLILVLLVLNNIQASEEPKACKKLIKLLPTNTQVIKTAINEFLSVESTIKHDYTIDPTKLKNHVLSHEAGPDVHENPDKYTDEYQYKVVRFMQFDKYVGVWWTNIIVILLKQEDGIYLMKFQSNKDVWELICEPTKLPFDGILGRFLIYETNNTLHIQDGSSGLWIQYGYLTNKVLSRSIGTFPQQSEPKTN